MIKHLLPGIAVLILVMTVISVTPALAADPASPPGCDADNSVVNIARSIASASPGETITFTVSAGNPVSVDGCDITNRVMTLTLPDNSTHVFGPFNYPNPSVVIVIGSADYVANTADLVGTSWTATVSWTGVLKDGFDQPSTGSKQLSVVYIPVNLTVTKTATPAIQQGYTWTIDKNVTPSSWTFNNGDSGTSKYTVSVVKSPSGTTYSVSGTITITNPSAFVSAHITSVTDAITPAINAVVDCPVSFPYDLAHGAQLICTYSSTLPDATTRTNEVDVTTTGDIGGGSGTAPVDFTGVQPTVTGDDIYVDDTNTGVGPWHFTDSGSVNYDKLYDCRGVNYDSSGHGSYCRSNTATIRGTALSDSATVCVDCFRPPVENPPQVYLLKKTFDICDQYGGDISGNEPLPGGSVPPSGIEGEGESQSGCVDFVGDRANEYLFTGEQIAILVAVRDLFGAEAITGANLLVDGVERVMCNDITENATALKAGTSLWYGHNVSIDLNQQPPAISPGANNGFNLSFDKLYQCIFTATSDDYSGDDGSVVVVSAADISGDVGESVPDNVFFNPAITLDIFTEPDDSLMFPAGTPGQIVYSTDTLKIMNTAEGGVDLFAWISGTDLFASVGAAKCPETNIIDVDKYMEYRCKIGTIFNNPWHKLPNPNDKLDCTKAACQGATPLMPDKMPFSIIINQHMAECWFRFTYPTPICVGDFSNGGEVIIYARAI